MPRKKNSRLPYRSSLSDSAHPGGPTTMEVLLRWLTTPGNVKRWRMEPHSPLVREVVEFMQKEGLAHRKAPFVRYKLDAIEKQYMTAKKWLLETGMHDVYMRGKASKEVRAHVESVCLHFKRLDPAFRGVPFSKKNAEPITLDGDSAGDVEVEGTHDEKDDDSDEEKKGEDYESEEEKDNAKDCEDSEGERKEDDDDQSVAPVAKSRKISIRSTKSTGKSAATSKEPQKRSTFRDRLFSQRANGAKEKALPPDGSQISSATIDAAGNENASTSAEPRKKTLQRSSSSTVNFAGKAKPLTPSEPKKNGSKLDKHRLSAAVEIAIEQAAPEAISNISIPAKTRKERPPASAATARLEVKKTAVNANRQKKATPKLVAAPRKRKISEEESSAVKRTRAQGQDEMNEELMAIEREALLQRIKDEQKQRHEVYELERSKLKCELESKQVQLLFEKASARKKLDLLGVSQEEIDCILPL